MQNHRIEIIESFEGWKRVAGAWNDLLNKSGAHTIFLTWEWLYSWAECYLNEKRNLFIIILYKNDEPLGIAPWYIHYTKYKLLGMRQIEFLGTPEAGSDYLDVIVQRGKEREVADSLYRFLFGPGRSRWDCMLLRDIPSQSLFLLHLQDIIESEGKYVELSKSSYCPAVTLPNKGESFNPGLSPKRKERFRQDLARLKKSGQIEHRVIKADACPDGMEEFFSFYNEVSGYDGRPLQRFLMKLVSHSADRNPLQINLLKINGKTVAGLLHLTDRDELLLFLMTADKAFNPKTSVGNVLVGLCLEQACLQGITRYDFLKGSEPYKFYWADSGRASLSIFLAQRKLSPLMFSTERFLKYTAKILLR